MFMEGTRLCRPAVPLAFSLRSFSVESVNSQSDYIKSTHIQRLCMRSTRTETRLNKNQGRKREYPFIFYVMAVSLLLFTERKLLLPFVSIISPFGAFFIDLKIY